jgi:excisionase family DNA binding protein
MPIVSQPLPEICSPDELAQLIGCTRRFLELERKRGRLRAIVLSQSMVRFRRSDIEAWLEASAE